MYQTLLIISIPITYTLGPSTPYVLLSLTFWTNNFFKKIIIKYLNFLIKTIIVKKKQIDLINWWRQQWKLDTDDEREFSLPFSAFWYFHSSSWWKLALATPYLHFSNHSTVIFAAKSFDPYRQLTLPPFQNQNPPWKMWACS